MLNISGLFSELVAHVSISSIICLFSLIVWRAAVSIPSRSLDISGGLLRPAFLWMPPRLCGRSANRCLLPVTVFLVTQQEGGTQLTATTSSTFSVNMVCLSVCLFVCLSTCPSICLSVSLLMYFMQCLDTFYLCLRNYRISRAAVPSHPSYTALRWSHSHLR